MYKNTLFMCYLIRILPIRLLLANNFHLLIELNIFLDFFPNLALNIKQEHNAAELPHMGDRRQRYNYK